jgi:MFS family permease
VGVGGGRAMGIFRRSQSLAFIMGPVLGGALAHSFSIYTPFYIDFLLTILAVMLFLFPVPEMEIKSEKLTLDLKPLTLIMRIWL